MEENYLQVGFEIKLACDALSRRILRWHWEKLPRPNTLRELMRYVEQRSIEAPEYYLNVTALKGEGINWQKLDTTFCMRVLLDAEANAPHPKKLLQYALNEGAARHACNGLRIARNGAAHATDKEAVVKAIAVFEDILIDLDNAYGLMLFETDELAQYDTLVARTKVACGAKQTAKGANTAASKPKTSPAQGAKKSQGKSGTTTRSTKTTAGKQATAKKPAAPKQPPKPAVSRELVFAGLAGIIFIAALCMHLMR